MQRTEPEGVVISCDFCGDDWDEIKHMIEGHHGSILCLACLKKALDQKSQPGKSYACTLCLREDIPASVPNWTGTRPAATACEDCLLQAARAFDKDPDVDWKWKRS